MSDDSIWIERAQSAEAKLKALQAQVDPLRERVRDVMAALCAREQRDGSFSIDYTAFVTKLGPDSAGDLRTIIDEKYGASLDVPAAKPGELVQMHPLAHLVGETVTIVSAGDGRKPVLRILPKPDEPRVKRKYTKRKAA